MTQDDTTKSGPRWRLLDTARSTRGTEHIEDVLHVESPRIVAPKLSSCLVMIGLPVVPLIIVARIFGDSILYAVIYLAELVFQVRREFQEARKARCIVRETVLEWITPGLMGGTDRIVATWDDIVWIGPFQYLETLKASALAHLMKGCLTDEKATNSSSPNP